MNIKYIPILLSSFFSLNCLGFVHQKTVNGESFTWGGQNTDSVVIYVNGDNSSGISNSDIYSQVVDSSSEWNQAGGPSLIVRSTTTSERTSRNDIYFTNDSSVFSGSSVLAVTESVYNSTTGRIIESDIKIKDSILFSTDSDNSLFIGDLISHELGHLVGLDHSTMPFSTMFYKLIRGQHSISFDDYIGKRSLYSQNRYPGKISGTIAGGPNKVNVFGADVKLISSNSGKVIASTLSDEDGSYIFEGIPVNDVYYVYVAPFRALDTVSSYYQTVQTDYCSSFSDFRGSFYQGCGNSRKGYPVGIHLTDSEPELNTGIVTIKCGLDVPSGYMAKRGVEAFELDDNENKEGDSFVGYFSSSDIESENYDEIYIDMSDVDTSDGSYYLDLRLVSQELYSKAGFWMEVTSGSSSYTYNYSVTSDNTPDLNLNGRIPLDSSIPSNNIFTVKIYPQDFEEFKGTTTFDTESLFFPDFATFGDDKVFYQFIYFLSKEQSNGEIELEGHYNYLSEAGNARCMEAEETYSVKSAGSVTGITNSSKRASQDQGVLACGTVAFVDDGNPPDGNGPVTVLVGFLLTFLLSLVKTRKNSF